MTKAEAGIRKMGAIADDLKVHGSVLADRMEEVVPRILAGEVKFEGSEFEELLNTAASPEHRNSMGWSIVEKVYRRKIKELFEECDNEKLKEELAEHIKKTYQYDPINNCSAGDSDEDYLNAMRYALEQVKIDGNDYIDGKADMRLSKVDEHQWCVQTKHYNNDIEQKIFGCAYHACKYILENIPQLDSEDSMFVIVEFHNYLDRIKAHYYGY